MIDPTLVENLNKVIEQTDAKVVISSSWRYGNTTDELLLYLQKQGFTGEVIDRTPVWKEYKDELGSLTANEFIRFWEYTRGNEIHMWLEKHDVESFVILDDEVSDIFPVFPDNYIRTDMERGFHSELIQEAIDKLNKEA